MKVRPSVYDTYWKFAAERQEIFFRKLRGITPLTKDPICIRYKFCNAYRASDRVSQYLIKHVIYQETHTPEDTLFRIFLFRLFNKPSTWEYLEKHLEGIILKTFSFSCYSALLSELKKTQPIYGNAFILCANKAYGYNQKHENHLALLESVFVTTDTCKQLLSSLTLNTLFQTLRELPLMGNFMAYQIAIDFTYSEVFDFTENDFTIPGPGAIRGIRKCFIDTDRSDGYIISYMVENQEKEFQRLGISFKSLWGRPLHAIDCQGLFCEVDKYSRVKFPDLKSNRKRIKTQYKPLQKTFSYFYPPKWGINEKISHETNVNSLTTPAEKHISYNT